MGLTPETKMDAVRDLQPPRRTVRPLRGGSPPPICSTVCQADSEISLILLALRFGTIATFELAKRFQRVKATTIPSAPPLPVPYRHLAFRPARSIFPACPARRSSTRAFPTRGTKVPTGPDWLHEIKHDGYRLTVRLSTGSF